MAEKTYEELEVEILEMWKNAGLTNDFVFCKVMEDPELCKHALELLLGKEISKIEYPKRQTYFKNALLTRGIRLDVYTKNDSQCFDLEIQTTNQSDILERARYYTAIMDADNLKPGMEFKSLKDNFVIFLCLKDPFNRGLPLYTYKTFCKEDESLQDDRTIKLFYNLEKVDKITDKSLNRFLTCLKTNKSYDEFTSKIVKKFYESKLSSDNQRWYMTTYMKEVYKYHEGLADGAAQNALENAVSLYKNGVSAEIIEKSIGITLEQIQTEIKKQDKD